MSVITPQLQRSWTQVSSLLKIQNERDYDLALERLNSLIDEVGTDEQHPLYSLLDTLGTVVHAWEEQHHPIPRSEGVDSLRFLMEEHELTQSDLPEVGSQGVFGDFGWKAEAEHPSNTCFVRTIRCLTLSIRIGSVSQEINMKTKAVFKTASPYLQDALNLPVENLEEAIPFYETIMGFQVVSRQDAPCKSAILARDDIQIG